MLSPIHNSDSVIEYLVLAKAAVRRGDLENALYWIGRAHEVATSADRSLSMLGPKELEEIAIASSAEMVFQETHA